MTENKEPKPHKSVRLPSFNYDESGAYSITIVTTNRTCLFGSIENGKMIANEFGQIVIAEWLRSAVIRPEIRLDVFALMPNHFHGIAWIWTSDVNDSGAQIHANERAHIHAALRGSRERAPRSISTFVSGFKGAVTARINTLRKTPGRPVWQPSFHEHVIRDDEDLRLHQEYVLNNPLQWELDSENPDFKP
jgi:REP element-mobilizing transposase RayT